ncbi:TetR/AcrR family transcriptional regulator [Arthrobacter sp. TB 26]|uniref:TetR/AcrR family transcriptional regulator n=1 Tax=Arthrobacter sp. TB 26 TaxID=494420 RepID=UPI00041703FD|nr:helix-turn-helix domain-containing protein [Arthrobacter sp. TB 26]
MPRANLNEQTVLQAAAALADREGIDAVTMAAVARTLGVKPASLYEHVQGRTGLNSGIQRLVLDELGSRIGESVAGRSGEAALRGLADAHRNYATERPGAWAALQRPATKETAQSPEAAKVATLMLAVIRGYPIPAHELIHATRLVASTVNGFLALTRAEAFAHRPDDLNESWAAALNGLERALASWPTERTPR